MNPKKEMKRVARKRNAHVVFQIDACFKASSIEVASTSINKWNRPGKMTIRQRDYSITPHFVWVGPTGKRKRINCLDYFYKLKYGITVLKWLEVKVDGRTIKNDDFFDDPRLDYTFIWKRVVNLDSYKKITADLKLTYERMHRDADKIIDDHLQTDEGLKELEKEKEKIMEEAAEHDFLSNISDDQIEFIFNNLNGLHEFMEAMERKKRFIEKFGINEFKSLIKKARIHVVMTQ